MEKLPSSKQQQIHGTATPAARRSKRLAKHPRKSLSESSAKKSVAAQNRNKSKQKIDCGILPSE